ncbi:DUSAM domain-containing protein [Myxococcus xanthus]|uniref:DUSAM domain-containing protein n=1 Tax=Myxococcus xanthus TaxID=34 RepID=A0A7Y4IF91_MYXXA|nr:DUSAM domain-containing protein [Myxococcus xanthus]NOJ77976.1 DUSAM domain-containing protein [Myxococcus xanthus]NOJ86607.1 DUSAM domain-containing protein [Myxococcus xanthus]
MADELEWEPVRALARRVRDGERLTLTAEVREMLERTAPEVGIGQADAAAALATAEKAETLLLECARRIKEGSDRIVDALYRAKRHRKAGDFDSARQEMREVLAVEVVPLYREIAEGQLEDIADEP